MAPTVPTNTPISSPEISTGAMQVVSNKRSQRTSPSRVDVPPSPAAPGTAHIYYRDGDAKVFVGSVTSRVTLTAFSTAARAHLMRYNPATKQSVMTPKAHEVILSKIDSAAGRAIIEVINNTNLHAPKPLLLSMLHEDSSIDFLAKVHQACHAFGLNHQLHGGEVRNAIFSYLRDLRHIELHDFKLFAEELYFDRGLVDKMQYKVALFTLNNWFSEDERRDFMYYAWDSDFLKGTNLMNGIAAEETKIQAERTKRDEEEAAKKAAEEFVFVHQSVAGKAKEVSSASKKATGGKMSYAQMVGA